MQRLNLGELMNLGHSLDIGKKKSWIFTCDKCSYDVLLDTGLIGVNVPCPRCPMGFLERNWKKSRRIR